MSKLTDQAILAGINDNSFEQGWKTGQENQNRKKNLEQYLSLREKDPKASISVTGAGNVSVNPEDPLASYLRGQQMKALEEERMDKKIQGVSDRVDKSGILQSAPALQSAEKSFQGKSVGPVLNVLPEWAQGIAANIKSRVGESLNKPEWKGTGEEFQDLQRLRNIDIRQFAGANQTMAEAARKMIEQGMNTGGSPEQVRQGMAMMRQALEGHAKNIEAGANPRAVAEYSRRQGIGGLSEILGKGPQPGQTASMPPAGPAAPAAAPGAVDPAVAARQRRIAELKAKQAAAVQGN